MSRLLHDCGEAMFGPRWQTDLARVVGVSDRTIRRWSIGDVDVPPGVWMELLRLTQERAMELDALVDRLKRESAPG